MQGLWFAAFGWAIAACWLWFSLRLWWFWRGARLGHAEGSDWPRVTVIVPARNEAASIEACLASLAAQDYPALQIVAVDDRSSDGTGAIMDATAKRHACLKVVHVKALPPTWLGKTHAMHQGFALSDGDYLLFTDGDVTFISSTLRRAMTEMRKRSLDHLCVFPRALPGGYLETALTQYFSMMLLFSLRPWGLGRSPRIYAGIGAFNLIRTEVYRAVGGHERLKAEIVDDMRLGFRVARSGYRSGLLFGSDALSLRWHHSLWQLICGVEKNSFPSQGFSWVILMATTATLLLAGVFPYLAIAVGTQGTAGYASALIVAHAFISYWNMRVANAPWYSAFALPAVTLLGLFAFWRSAVMITRNRGIRWRDTFYPLEFFRR